MGSANNNMTNFIRQFDDWEVWDGMPDGDPTPPVADKIKGLHID